MPIDENWLAQHTETAREPNLPIIDPHHHLWDRPGDRYMLHDLLADTGTGHNITATVYVDCGSMYRADGPEHMKPVGEVEFANGVAAQSASGEFGPTRACHGIVSYADMTRGEAVDDVLEAQLAAAPERFRGIRHSVCWDPSKDVRSVRLRPRHLLADQAFRAGVARLGALGLSFEAWLYHTQIPELTEMARAIPEVTIVLDHFGGPLGIGPYAGQQDAIYRKWKGDIAALAECPNVVAKLGGINMAINGFGWHERERPPSSEELAEATSHYYLHSIDCFGPERCMFESNFPVDKTSCSYVVLWNSFKLMTKDFTPAERAALFHDTAARVYRLEGV